MPGQSFKKAFPLDGREYLLGFELLVYSYAPIGFPTPDWAKVVERVNCFALGIGPQLEELQRIRVR